MPCSSTIRIVGAVETNKMKELLSFVVKIYSVIYFTRVYGSERVVKHDRKFEGEKNTQTLKWRRRNVREPFA